MGLLHFYYLYDSWTLGCAIKIISAFPPTLEYSESQKGWGEVQVHSSILPEGAKLGPHGIMVLKIMKRCSLKW
jgi:hypothetical protein